MTEHRSFGARSFVAGLVCLGLTTACDQKTPDTVPPASTAAVADAEPATAVEPEAAPAPQIDDAWAKILGGSHRTPKNKARDAARHPAQTLAFFGVKPDSTVVELWPGGGWYTEILAPYLKNEGRLLVTMADPKGPAEYYGTRQANEMLGWVQGKPEVFGKLEHVVVPMEVKVGDDKKVSGVALKPFELAPAGSVDVVLTFRNSHGWFRGGEQALVYGAAFKALKSGGVFGVVQHRAAEGSDPNETVKDGYLPEKTIIDAAEGVGFKLAERSEVNANPKDTRDHPKGVWTLPPGLRLGDQDRDKYVAIGESDRMTLKFVKP